MIACLIVCFVRIVFISYLFRGPVPRGGVRVLALPEAAVAHRAVTGGLHGDQPSRPSGRRGFPYKGKSLAKGNPL